MGITSVFIKTRMHWGNENCWQRLPSEARRAKNRGRRPRAGWDSWEGAASPTSSEAWQWCKQDQILKTKTKITRPRPGSPEVNKGTFSIAVTPCHWQWPTAIACTAVINFWSCGGSLGVHCPMTSPAVYTDGETTLVDATSLQTEAHADDASNTR